MEQLVSIVVPVYNVVPYLERCVASIVAQTYKNLEIILVDDGSTDESGALCETLQRQDERIRVIHKPNGGMSDARNVGAQAAIGDYLLFVDSDDYIDSIMVEVLLTQLLAEEADVSICNIMNVYTNRQTPQLNDPSYYEVVDRIGFLKHYLVGDVIPGSICNKLMTRAIFDQLVFPVGKTYEDAFYQFDLMQVANRFVVCGQPLYYYFHRSGSDTTQPFTPRVLDCIEIYQRYYEWVLENQPDLATAAFFRLAYAHFMAFDRLLLLPDYTQHVAFGPLLIFLREHSLKIALNPHFRLSRRVASIVLKVSVSGYRRLLLKDIQHHKGINES